MSVRGPTGFFVPLPSAAGERCRAFVPHPLPPDPPVSVDEGLQNLLARANLALGRLDGLTRALPDPALFLYSYVRKEAVLSSQIEGTQSSLSDLLLFESEAVPGVPLDDVEEVSSYVGAMNKGLSMIREGLPVCLRVIREVHSALLASGRGSQKEPGEFRNSQNWIGGTRPGNAVFVPPPADYVLDCLGDLEGFLNKQSETPVLIKAALAHVQFETIHPFLDGNGRVGRLLIPLLLCAEGALREPILYPSLYFKTHRQQYYGLLQSVRQEGAWEEWLGFFLTGVEESADQACSTAHRLLDVAAEDAQKIHGLGKAAGTTLQLHKALQYRPILSVTAAAKELNLSFPAVNKAFEKLQNLKLAVEITGRARNRMFAYERFLRILSEETSAS